MAGGIENWPEDSISEILSHPYSPPLTSIFIFLEQQPYRYCLISATFGQSQIPVTMYPCRSASLIEPYLIHNLSLRKILKG